MLLRLVQVQVLMLQQLLVQLLMKPRKQQQLLLLGVLLGVAAVVLCRQAGSESWVLVRAATTTAAGRCEADMQQHKQQR
jgi:hypothetical protein